MKLLLALFSLLAVAKAAPWIQDVGKKRRIHLKSHEFHRNLDLPLPREVDAENPIAPHESACNIFYVYNFPMTCGDERVFEPTVLACVPPADSTREECKDFGGGGEE